MRPLLREAPVGRIVNVSGSLTLNADPAFPHRAVFGNYSACSEALRRRAVIVRGDRRGRSTLFGRRLGRELWSTSLSDERECDKRESAGWRAPDLDHAPAP